MNALLRVPEKQLKGLELLQQHRPKNGRVFPSGLKRKDYHEATVQMVEYAQNCASVIEDMEKLRARPVKWPMLDASL